MKRETSNFIRIFSFFFNAFFSFRKKAILFCIPEHPNLGDQAQLMCSEKWIKENYQDYKLLTFPQICAPFSDNLYSIFFNSTFWAFIVLKLSIRKKDIFFGHSGYFFVDHHSGWYSFAFLSKYWKNQFVILPQTINFYAPVVKQLASKAFKDKTNLTILCRDQVSFQNAKELFGSTKLLLFPDIVTSLIGTRTFSEKKEGILFCMRNDVEAFYSPREIENLMDQFGNIHKEKIDTSLNISARVMKRERDTLINNMIEKIASYKVVITDRYHGTIFSAIANTPVIVINSADHKLISGVKWFPSEEFGNNVQFAENLNEAYQKAICMLGFSRNFPINPAYFKERYWDKLTSILNHQVFKNRK